MVLWAQPLRQFRSTLGQPKQASAPVGTIDPAVDQTVGLHLTDKMAGAGSVDAKPQCETVPFDAADVQHPHARAELYTRRVLICRLNATTIKLIERMLITKVGLQIEAGRAVAVPVLQY